MNRNHSRKAAVQGFSLIEMMIAVTIVTVVFAIAMQAVTEMVQRKNVENNKIDLVQESREFMDQITNDIHQSGYPSYRTFDYTSASLISLLPMSCPTGVSSQMYIGAYTATPTANACPPTIAVGAGGGANGLMSVTASSVQFEADVDGTGVSEVFIQLVQTNGSSTACSTPPCVMQRGIISKSAWVAGGTIYYYTELNDVMNTQIFTAYDVAGNPIAFPIAAGSLQNITDIGITLYVRAASPDLKTGVYPSATMVSDAKVKQN